MKPEDTSEENNLLAAEYALGLLEGDALAQARHLAAIDRDFARAVTDWEIRLSAMSDELATETPGPAVKAALMAQLFPQKARQSFWQKLWVWQTMGAVSLLLLVAVIATDLGKPRPAGGPLYTAEILSEAGDFRVVAVVDKSTNEVFLTKTAGAAPQGRILQVWAHGPDAPAISVGLWPEGDTIRLPMPRTIAAVEGVLTLGVSEEPIGGSPTGSPTGRVFGTIDIPGVSSSL